MSNHPDDRGSALGAVGRYDVLGKISINTATDVLLGRSFWPEGDGDRLVVIKRVHPAFAHVEPLVEEFLDDARMAMRFMHSHIASVYDVERDGDDAFLVMELLYGRDLRAVMRRMAARGVRLPLALALSLVRTLCQALDYAHRLNDEVGWPFGFVHRYVGPHNVHVAFGGEVKLRGFTANRARRSTRTLPAPYEVGYISPEHFRGRPLDRRADVFSLGVLLHELTTGRRLYRGDTPFAIMQASLNEPARRPSRDVPGYPAALEKVVMAALDQEPDRRPRTAALLAEQLRDVQRQLRLSGGQEELARCMEQLYAEELDEVRRPGEGGGDPRKRLLAELRNAAEEGALREGEVA